METDKQRFTKMFRELRKFGFVARQNYMCCQGCGWNALATEYGVEDDTQNAVFYHQQDHDNFDKKGNLKNLIYLSWQGDGTVIKETAEKFGYTVEWDGTTSNRIGILPIK